MSLSPHEASLRGRIGAYAAHARHDTRELTRAAREAFLTRFLDQVDPNRVLPETERQRRADAARRAHMARLALSSARSRRAARKQSNASPDSPPVGDEGHE
jgi:hypothetical protein